MAKATALPGKRTGQGFTLVELLLALVLVLLLAGALVFSFSSLLDGSQLEEGAGQVESLLRYARAHAANTGRKVQLLFSEEDETGEQWGNLRLTWEPDPLGDPGYFEDLADAGWQTRGINELVEVEAAQLLGAAATVEHATGGGEQRGEAALPEPYPPITFYPDGSSDSAEIVLISRANDEQRMLVRLDGISGAISHRLIRSETDSGPSERDQTEAEAGSAK